MAVESVEINGTEWLLKPLDICDGLALSMGEAPTVPADQRIRLWYAALGMAWTAQPPRSPALPAREGDLYEYGAKVAAVLHPWGGVDTIKAAKALYTDAVESVLGPPDTEVAEQADFSDPVSDGDSETG